MIFPNFLKISQNFLILRIFVRSSYLLLLIVASIWLSSSILYPSIRWVYSSTALKSIKFWNQISTQTYKQYRARGLRSWWLHIYTPRDIPPDKSLKKWIGRLKDLWVGEFLDSHCILPSIPSTPEHYTTSKDSDTPSTNFLQLVPGWATLSIPCLNTNPILIKKLQMHEIN